MAPLVSYSLWLITAKIVLGSMRNSNKYFVCSSLRKHVIKKKGIDIPMISCLNFLVMYRLMQGVNLIQPLVMVTKGELPIIRLGQLVRFFFFVQMLLASIFRVLFVFTWKVSFQTSAIPSLVNVSL